MRAGSALRLPSLSRYEKLTQTLRWICPKPLSSEGLVLAKFADHAVFIGTIALGVRAAVTYSRFRLDSPHPTPYTPHPASQVVAY
jgi:hypothetical protein